MKTRRSFDVRDLHGVILAKALLLVFVADSAQAMEPVLLDPLLVVETRVPTPYSQLSPSTTFIELGSVTGTSGPFVAEVLRSTPGINIATSGGPGGPISLFSRGAESNHTAVLLDGRRLNPGLGGGYDLPSITTDTLARIEVLRGASSTLWGAEGIGGVINLVTRDPLTSGDRPRGVLLLEGGSFDTWRASASAAGRAGVWGGEFEAAWFDTENEQPNSDYELRSLRANVGLALRDDARLETLVYFTDGRGGSPGPRTFMTPNDRFAQRTWSVSPGWRFGSPAHLEARGFYSVNRQRYHFVSPPWSDDLSVILQHELDQQFAWLAAPGVQAAAGFNVQHADIRGDSFGARAFDERQTNLGVWTQWQFEPAEDWRFVAGARWDDYSDFGSPFTWNVVAHRRLPAGFSVFGKVASAYAPPSHQDLYYPGFNNPELRAEESLNFEAGARWELPEARSRVALVAFRNDIDDFIQFASRLENGVLVGRPRNVAEARISGVELSGSTRVGDAITVHGGYTWLEAHNRTSDVRLVRRPRHQFTGEVVVRATKEVELTFGARWVVDREDISAETFLQTDVPDYFVARMSAQWRASDAVSIFGRIENLFDETYDEIDGYAALDRAAHVGMRLAF